MAESKKKYSLIGVDGNAFSVMAYTAKAMEDAGYSEEEISQMYQDAESSNYNHLLAVCSKWVAKVNTKLGLR